jgi:hypothetical protein
MHRVAVPCKLCITNWQHMVMDTCTTPTAGLPAAIHRFYSFKVLFRVHVGSSPWIAVSPWTSSASMLHLDRHTAHCILHWVVCDVTGLCLVVITAHGSAGTPPTHCAVAPHLTLKLVNEILLMARLCRAGNASVVNSWFRARRSSGVGSPGGSHQGLRCSSRCVSCVQEVARAPSRAGASASLQFVMDRLRKCDKAFWRLCAEPSVDRCQSHSMENLKCRRLLLVALCIACTDKSQWAQPGGKHKHRCQNHAPSCMLLQNPPALGDGRR